MDVRRVEVLIAGGGPAGMGAAMMLGRMARSVMVVDSGETRNRSVHRMHGYLTRDGVTTRDFDSIAKGELGEYASIEVIHAEIADVKASANGFIATLDCGNIVEAERFLLATGIFDILPDIAGIADAWGRGVYSCPYCHGWEMRDGVVAVAASGRGAADVAMRLRRLAKSVTLISARPLAGYDADIASRFGLRTIYDTITKITSVDGGVMVDLQEGGRILLNGLFMSPRKSPRSALAGTLGCELTMGRRIKVDKHGRTSISRVFAAGDVADGGFRASQVLGSAADGAAIGISIDESLLYEAIDGELTWQ